MSSLLAVTFDVTSWSFKLSLFSCIPLRTVPWTRKGRVVYGVGVGSGGVSGCFLSFFVLAPFVVAGSGSCG